jgi:glycine cleavage system H lipoate-binding protein
MLALFNALTEEDKDIVISMSDALVRKYGIFLKVKMHKTGQKKDVKRSFV